MRRRQLYPGACAQGRATSALVVEIGEGALRELFGFFVAFRDDARILYCADAVLVRVRNVTRPRAVNRSGKFENRFLRPLRRIQPVTPQLIERPRALLISLCSTW